MLAVDAVSPFEASVAVAVTVRVKSVVLLGGEVIVRPLVSAPIRVQVPSPLSVPAESAPPNGTPAMVIERLSEPSRSVSAAVMLRAIGSPGGPIASCTVRVGASAAASIVTETVALAVRPSSSVRV